MKYIYMLTLAAAIMAGCSKETPDNGGDGTGKEPTDPVIEDTYEVGDYYEEGFVKGVVFAVDETGLHGTVVSLTETTAVWSYKNNNVMEGTPSGYGMDNCKKVYAIEDWKTNYPGFLWCYEMNPFGLENWYIPSRWELYSLYKAYTGVSGEESEEGGEGDGGEEVMLSGTMSVEEHKEWFNKCLVDNGGVPISDTVYWSSDESGPTISYPFDMAVGDQILYPNSALLKNNEYKFRAICNF